MSLFPSPVYPDMRIGLLGGSFNPAHDGHRHISLIALRRLALHQVWWLVSPQNPLKPTDTMAPIEDRLTRAQAISNHPDIHVSDLETKLGTQFTVDTLHALKQRLPHVKLVWLMGADNLQQMDQWKEWPKIMESVPVAVIARPGYAQVALSSKVAQRYAHTRIAPYAAKSLASRMPPAWVFVQEDLHPQSGTVLRAKQTKKRKKKAKTK